jgi:hypothetical protein
VQETGEQVIRIVAHGCQDHTAPTLGARKAEVGDSDVGIQADAVHAHHRCRDARNQHQDHDAFQVDRVAYMRRAAGNRRRAVKDRIDHLVKRGVFLQLAALGEQRFEPIQQFAKS